MVIPALVPERFRLRTNHIFLLIASYFFYMSWKWQFGMLMMTSTLIDYFAGLELDRHPADRDPEHTRKRKLILLFSMITNLGILSYFKYVDFFIGSFVELVNSMAPGTWTPGEKNSLLLHVILPLGISFFTFQSMSYTIDVYRRVIPAERSFIRFALFVSFFPQLVAGPIVTAKEFLPQMARYPDFDLHRMRSAARWFALGYFKKAVLADNMAPVVDAIFRDPGSFGPSGHWLAAIGFWIQVYNDFSGYSDMAIGTAIFMGYDLPINFHLPYLSTSPGEHWRRWHISLMRWLRDYLYIPLGGNRVSPGRFMWNQFFVMFLAGLWHGANWTFVVWGSIHGVVLILERLFYQIAPEARSLYMRILKGIGGFLITSLITIVFGTIFRAQSIQQAWIVLQGMAGFADPAGVSPSPSLFRPVLEAFLVMVLGHTLGYFIFIKKSWKPKVPLWLELALIPPVILILSQLAAGETEAFIYFVF